MGAEIDSREYYDLEADIRARENGRWSMETRLDFYLVCLKKERERNARLIGVCETLKGQIAIRDTMICLSATTAIILAVSLFVVLVQWVL